MNPIRIFTPPLLAVALVSCAAHKASEYDTSNPYGTPDGGPMDPFMSESANPIYDTPAAYEESSGFSDTAAYPEIPAAPANAPATIHTVVVGDTLSGLSAKYKVSIASIKRANRMTNDIVVLGRKMVIPPH